LVFENIPLESVGSLMAGTAGLNVQRVAGRRGGETNYPLTVVVVPGRTLQVRFTYDTEHYTAEAITRMVGHFQQVLTGMVGGTEQKLLGAVPLLTETERQQVLVEWNDTEKDYPKDKTLAQLFEEQVERSPEAVAIEYEDAQLTYCELNSRANQLAHYLKSLGVGPEIMVGLYMERSLDMVVGIYGIIKAGGAYVPLDPEYPPDRVSFMIEDTNVPVLLTQEHLVASLPEQKAKVICLDLEWDLIAAGSIQNPAVKATPENLAYVIYTSGSTGRPKGVMNEHRGIVNRLLWMQDKYRLFPEDRLLQKTPFSFDVSVWEFFWPLQAGASLVMAQPGGHKDSAYLVELIIDRGITTLHFVPSMLQVFLEEHGVEQCKGIKRVICSGEALSFELQSRFFKRLDAELHNLYGPTEAAVDVTYWACRADSERNFVPIGIPVANTQMYILDHGLHPVPIGCTGELHIGGVQVARGYLNRVGLTAEKFMPDPFNDDPNACLYKTGDLARYLPDGNIEYLGRIDNQVKIRGFRIELGEVESVLGRHPAVEEAVVIAREDVPDDKRLVAYVVASHEPTPTFSELRSFLKEKLPDYMIPTALVFLDLLPLTPNGKVDRRALPAPDRNRSQPAEALVAPRDGLELQLTKIWETVLGVKNIGMKDNFFDLGGHSLLAVRLFALIQKRFSKDLPLTILFQAPTIGQLARIIRQAGWTSPWSSLVPIHHGGSKPPFFCVHGCTGRILHFHDLARHLNPEQPFYGLAALGLEKGQVPHYHIEDMAAHYINEIRTIQFDGPYFIGGSGWGCPIVLEMAHQLESQGQNLALIVLLSPSPLKLNISTSILHTYYRYRREYFRLLINLFKKRPLIPAIQYAFFNQVLLNYRIFHRFIPIEIHRWRRTIAAISRARFSYTPRAYQGRITCLIRDEFSHNYKKGLHDWYELAAGELDIEFVPGNNWTMWQEPHVQILAEKLTACLNEAQKNS
jgi:amino acid adenylation domain-containing protein